jgi:hypothetical protein
MDPLGFDELLKVMETLYFDQDFSSLFSCSLTSKSFHQAASKVLYSRVVFDPPFSKTLRLGARDELPVGD